MKESTSPRSVELERRAQGRSLRVAGCLAWLALTALSPRAGELEILPLPESGEVQAISAFSSFPDETTAMRDALPSRADVSIGMAFARSDRNGDGQLSRAEALRLPVIHMRFDEFDTDGNGLLNLVEFEAGALSPP